MRCLRTFEDTDRFHVSLSGELAATRRLCELYTSQSPDPDRSLVYHQHQVELLRRTGDRGQEGDALETLSQLCLRLDTERWRVLNKPTCTHIQVNDPLPV